MRADQLQKWTLGAVLGEPEWERFDVGICRGLEAEAELWEPEEGLTPMTDLLTPEFVDYMEGSCQ